MRWGRVFGVRTNLRREEHHHNLQRRKSEQRDTWNSSAIYLRNRMATMVKHDLPPSEASN
jgi:hypothetical protein